MREKHLLISKLRSADWTANVLRMYCEKLRKPVTRVLGARSPSDLDLWKDER